MIKGYKEAKQKASEGIERYPTFTGNWGYANLNNEILFNCVVDKNFILIISSAGKYVEN